MLVEMLSDYSFLESTQILDIIDKSPTHYKMYFILKKNGGHRQIFHPSKTTKMLQYAVIDLFLSKIEVHPSAIAYIPKNEIIKVNPIKYNAIQHAPFHYSLHLDFSNFFPSITPATFWKKVTDSEILNKFSDEERKYFNRIIFINFRGETFLSIGAPSSPMVSNIFMREFDKKVCEFVNSADINGVYTRYADDIWISSNNKEASKKSYEYILSIMKNEYTNLSLNEKKTYFCSIKGRRCITGLTVTPEGNVLVPQAKKRFIRSLIYKYASKKLDNKDEKYLKGYISFIKDIEPSFLNSLLIKYGDKMDGLY
jgi:RNA-directed DNA polymerase